MPIRYFNGLLIDCSRLMERHKYYFKLIDFMSDWKMNTLLLHFTDDHGCAVKLPGFPGLAMRNAFSSAEVKKLVNYASRKGIDIIPEVESFGHTRYLTDKAKYRNLYAGRKTKTLKFNALDPLNEKSLDIIKQLLRSTSRIFKSKYIHIGCDEVNIREYCKLKGGLDEETVWADYVNKVIGSVKHMGKIPMMWGDHPGNNSKIAGLLRKDVIMVYWQYGKIKKGNIERLKKTGFKNIVLAPALAWFLYRFLPTEEILDNTVNMIKNNAKYNTRGIINTIWCPYRYIQKALYYGIAYSSYGYYHGGKINTDKFNELFAKEVFGSELTEPLKRFLKYWPKLSVGHALSKYICSYGKYKLTDRQKKSIININKIGKNILPVSIFYKPVKNPDIWHAMLLSAKAAWLCSEFYIIKEKKIKDKAIIDKFKKLAKETVYEASKEWDKTRYSNDMQKLGPKFPGEEYQYALVLLENLLKI